MPAHVCVIDVETTGLDERRDSLIEIGARFPDGKIFQRDFRPRPGSAIDAQALAVNGWSINRLDALETGWVEGVESFFAWLRERGRGPFILAGFNPALDLKFLRAAWVALGRQPRWFPFAHAVIDLHSWVCLQAILEGKPIPERGFSSDAASEFLRVPEEQKPHRAWRGATWCSEGLARVMEEVVSVYPF